MASISDPVPLPLNLSTHGSKVHATAVLNCKNEAVLAIDGEGLFIYSIAPSRALSAFSTGPEVKFRCSPVAIRLDPENSVTFALTEEKGDTTLLRWVQNGVEYSTQKIPLSLKKSDILSLHVIDDTGDFLLVSYNNTRIEYIDIATSKVEWTWNTTREAAHLSTFSAKHLSTFKDSQGYILLVGSEQAQFYPLSTTNPPAESISSRSLNDSEEVSYTTFDVFSKTFYQLSRETLHILKPNQQNIAFRLPSLFTQIFPLSTSHVLLTSPNTVLIYDIIYGTVQSTYSLPTSSVILTTIHSLDPNNFHLLLSSEKPIVIPITIPSTSTLLSILNSSSETISSRGVPPLLISSRQNLKPKEILSAKDLLQQLESLANKSDPERFDKTFTNFLKKYKITQSTKDYKPKLTPIFVKELMALIFTISEGGIQVRVYPEETIDFILKSGSFSRDAIPGTGEDKFVLAAMQHEGFLTRVLETDPSPLTFRDFLVLIKTLLESKERMIGSVNLEMIFEGFERNVDTFFDMGDMKCVLSTDNLHSLLSILTSNTSASNSFNSASDEDVTSMIRYPALLTSVLDSIGLAQLFLPTTLPLSLLDSLLTNLSSETQHVGSCLSTSAILSLVMHRQRKSLGKPPKWTDPAKESRKRKRGEVEIVAEEGGGRRRRVMWIKRDPVPSARSGVFTSRFMATAKFLEVPSYSLDKMVVNWERKDEMIEIDGEMR